MTAFDEAWAVVKADTGLWDEIYAPLYESYGGRGEKKGGMALDFMPTEVAMKVLLTHLGDNVESFRHQSEGDKGWDVDQLKENIWEYGFSTAGRTGNPFPNFAFDPQGVIDQGEGRHRTMALHELGAPYIPSFGQGTYRDLKDDYSVTPEWKINPVYDDASQYSAASYFGPDKGRYPTPPSWIFDQELIPDMGRLIPVIDGQPISDEEMREHIMHTPDRRMDEWVKRPEWSVVHDD